MRRNFLTGLIICLIPTLIAGIYVGRGFIRESHGETGFRRGIDLAGGTILVYEVNLKQGQSELSSDDIKQLAENLKRRIDPNDMKNIVVRPLGTSRVEIILPLAGSAGGERAGTTENEIQEVKNLVAQVGVLEFRILANDTDDDQGIRDAERVLASAATDPKAKEVLTNLAKAGLPPPGPTTDGRPDGLLNEYTVMNQDGVRYAWIKLGKEEMETLLVDRTPNRKIATDANGNVVMSSTWQALRASPDKPYHYPLSDKEGRQGSYLIYSRPFIKSAPSKAEEWEVGKHEYFVLSRVSPADMLKVSRDVGLKARVETDQRTLSPAVAFSFNSTGAARFGAMTERNRPTQTTVRTMAIVMDEKVVSAPYLAAVLRDGGQISGPGFDLEAVKRLVRILQSGALNAELKPDPVSENTVGPTLGEDTIRKGLLAVGLAFAGVMAFMVVYYRFAGMVACIALLANLLLTVGFMVLVNAAFTLPGLAGIVLMLGMAVDANVLIYERIREERERGANLVTAIRQGYDRAFPTIIDTHLTSIFTAIVLYMFGNDQLKGFAVSLTVGLIISLFTALYMTRLIFDYAIAKKWVGQLRMLRLFPRPNYDFMKLRYPMFAITGALTIFGLVLFLARGEAGLNVDFTKGTAYGGRLKEGEARGLTTSNGKPGFLDLLGESRQEQRLKVKDVQWLTKPVANDDPNAPQRTAEYIYEVTYDDGSKAVVTLANAPEGATEAEQLADVKTRASGLPGLSVEQVFVRGVDDNLGYGLSRSFTVRTTEKEPELVQVMLDRLLRDEKTNEQLLATAKITDVQINGPVAIVTLDKPASPNYLKGFILRELKLVNRIPLVSGTPAVEVTGVPTTGDSEAAKAQLLAETRSGQYTKLRIDVSKNPEFQPLSEGKKEGPEAKKAADDLTAYKNILSAASKSFEARPLPERLETFDPALAADTRSKAAWAIFLSWLAILGYLWFRFGSWTFGLAAVICLIHDLCFTLGCIALCHFLFHTAPGQLLGLQDFKIDLAAVAALLTLVGYSVNDTIVVFDRIKEVRGKNPILTPAMINESVNGTLSRTVLASLTVFIVVGVLYIFGGEGVHLFSFVMVIGVIVGTYSSIYIASPLLLIFGEGRLHAPTPGVISTTSTTSV